MKVRFKKTVESGNKNTKNDANKVQSGEIIPKKVNNEANTRNLVKSGEIGVKFSKDHQPDPEAKKLGWKKLREQRHATQEILKRLLNDDGSPTNTLREVMDSIIENAKGGNPKCLDILMKGMEDDITKQEIIHSFDLNKQDIEFK